MSKARDIADLDFNAPDIDGGNIDGAVIGGTTAAAISGTTIVGTRISLSDGVDDAGSAGSESVFNNGGTTADFRVESTADANMFFVDGGNNKVGIGTSSPASLMHLSATAPVLSFTDTNSFTDVNDRFIVRAASNGGYIQWYDDSASATRSLMSFFDSEVVVNDDGNDRDFRVESDGNANMLFVDGGNNRVGVGVGTPENPLHINDTSATSQLLIQGDSNDASIKFNKSGQTFVIGIDATDNSFRFSDGTTLGSGDRLTIASDGAATFSSSVTVGTKIFTGGMTLTNNDSGRIGFNRNPDSGASVNSSSLQRHQINGANSAGDYLDFQSYNSSGTYVGGFVLNDGAFITSPTAGKSAVFNENGIDADFRVESEGNANMLFVDGDTNTVGIGTNSPLASYALNVSGASNERIVIDSTNNTTSGIYMRVLSGGALQGNSTIRVNNIGSLQAYMGNASSSEGKYLDYKVNDGVGNGTAHFRGNIGISHHTSDKSEYMIATGTDNSYRSGVAFQLQSSQSQWQVGYVKIKTGAGRTGLQSHAAAEYLYRFQVHNEGISGIGLASSSGDTGSFTVSVTSQNPNTSTGTVELKIRTTASTAYGTHVIVGECHFYGGINKARREI